MPTTTADGVTICFETRGDPRDPTLLLVMGFTSQLVAWEEGFLAELTGWGFHVVVYDNRDTGLSTHFDGVPANLGEVMRARRDHRDGRPFAPYTLSDMAADGIAVLDALGVERAHVAGISMGGMIVQTIALEHRDRVLSLASIMSHTGEPAYGRSTDEANAALMTPPPEDRDAFVDYTVAQWRLWSSRYHWDEGVVRARAARSYDRAFYPEGAGRQLAAIMASGDRAHALTHLRIPTVVVHGRQDALIQQSGGERTAELVPDSRLLILDGMGHDLPAPLWPAIVDAVVGNAERAGFQARPH